MKECKVTIIIPNYNGLEFLPECIAALKAQTYRGYRLLVVDNASTDGSVEWLKSEGVESLFLDKNYGFAGGVNRGIEHSDTDYVILLNNDTVVFPRFVERLVKAIERNKNIFSVNPMMIQYHHRQLMDDAGDGLCVLGFAYQIGVGESIHSYNRRMAVFSSCAGASIYRREVFDEIGLFDELHFAYLEDVDVGYRARLHGYRNIYEPSAKVYHIGSGTSGSKYNSFKVRLAARNQIYLLYKNQNDVQLLINFIPITLGILIKWVFFIKLGFAKDYLAGIYEGITTLNKTRRVNFRTVNILSLLDIELRMIVGVYDYILHFIRRRIDRIK